MCLIVFLLIFFPSGLATSVVTSFYWIMIFLSAQTFEAMINFLGWSLSYGMFATICISGTLFIIFLIPETKGKNREQIELHYGRKSTVRRVSLRHSLTHRGIPDSSDSGEGGPGRENPSFQHEEEKV
jgi:hypothetical protein